MIIPQKDIIQDSFNHAENVLCNEIDELKLTRDAHTILYNQVREMNNNFEELLKLVK